MCKLKVALFANAIVQEQRNGTQTFLLNILSKWITQYADRMDVTFFSTKEYDINRLDNLLPPGQWRKIQLPHSYWPLRMAWLYGARSVTSKIGHHDVYLSGWHWPLGRQDRPFIGIIHDLRPLDPDWYEPSLSFARRHFWRWVYAKSTKECGRHAAAIVCPSNYTLEHVGILDIEIACPTLVIPHGIDLDYWSQPLFLNKRRAIFEKLCLDLDTKYVLCIGQHTPHKNMPRLVEAFGKHLLPHSPESHLIIAGSKNVETPQLEQMTVSMGLSGRVHLLGTVSDEELRILMKCAHIFSFPSLFEGFGLPVLEAFASGVPVVCSNTTSLGEVGGEAAITIDPENVEAIGDALVCLWNDDSLRSQFIEKGFQRAKYFSWGNSAKSYLDLFEKTLSIQT